MDAKRFSMLNNPCIPLCEGIDPPAGALPVRYVDVKGREEHEAFLKDPQKCAEHGLDVMYETMVYLKRWGGWLNDKTA